MEKNKDYYKMLHKQNEKDSALIIKIFLIITLIMGVISFSVKDKIIISENKITDTIIITKDNDTLKLKIYKD